MPRSQAPSNWKLILPDNWGVPKNPLKLHFLKTISERAKYHPKNGQFFHKTLILHRIPGAWWGGCARPARWLTGTPPLLCLAINHSLAVAVTKLPVNHLTERLHIFTKITWDQLWSVRSSLVHSHWSRNVEASLSLIESLNIFMVLLYQFSYAIKNQLVASKAPY